MQPSQQFQARCLSRGIEPLGHLPRIRPRANRPGKLRPLFRGASDQPPCFFTDIRCLDLAISAPPDLYPHLHQRPSGFGAYRRCLRRRFESVERRHLSGHLFPPRACKGRPRSLQRACTGIANLGLARGRQQLRRCPLFDRHQTYSMPQPVCSF